MRANVPPHREPGRRVPPEGVRLRGPRAKSPPRPRSARAPRPPRDFVLRRHARTYEDAESLQGSAEIAADFLALAGHEPLFGLSAWIVSDVSEPLPLGYAWASVLAGAGFPVVSTPELIGRGHVTILLPNPVTEAAARAFNAAFGRIP